MTLQDLNDLAPLMAGLAAYSSMESKLETSVPQSKSNSPRKSPPTPKEPPAFARRLKDWRQRRHVSQLDLALDCEISQRHLSFLELGRALPSRDMVLHICEHLGLPLRERNVMLAAAGFAPIYLSRALDDPTLAPAKAAIELVLTGHEPYPAMAIDRHWNVLMSNGAARYFLSFVKDQTLLHGTVNVLRLTLHPEGLAPHIDNLNAWRHHLLQRLSEQIELTADPALISLKAELLSFPVDGRPPRVAPAKDEIFFPMEITTPLGKLSFFYTMTVFGSPVDVTLSEIAIEALFPANEETRQLCSQFAPKDTPVSALVT